MHLGERDRLEERHTGTSLRTAKAVVGLSGVNEKKGQGPGTRSQVGLFPDSGPLALQEKRPVSPNHEEGHSPAWHRKGAWLLRVCGLGGAAEFFVLRPL